VTSSGTATEPASVAEPGPEAEPAAAQSRAEAATTSAQAETGTTTSGSRTSTTDPETQAGTTTSEARPGSIAEPRPDADLDADPEAAPDSSPEADSEPGAAAAVKSRLPAIMRTMAVTAIDRPQQETGQVGRPGRAALAGAAVVGALLVSVPFLVLGGDGDKDREAPPSAGTVLGGGSQEAPGDFAVTTPDATSSGQGASESGKPEKQVRNGSDPAGTQGKDQDRDQGGNEPKSDAAQKDRPKKQGGGDEKESGGTKDEPAKAGSGVTLSAPVSLRSHLSGRCIDVPGGDFGDGKKLFVWDCNNGEAQKWRFASDGTIRIKGMCLDVANANFGDGSPIQIAWCSGNAAQKFVLNGSHDLVNTVVGKCVDIKDNNRGNGAWLQLWSCAGTDNQKWSV
jgi:hypothetical protein